MCCFRFKLRQFLPWFGPCLCLMNKLISWSNVPKHEVFLFATYMLLPLCSTKPLFTVTYFSQISIPSWSTYSRYVNLKDYILFITLNICEKCPYPKLDLFKVRTFNKLDIFLHFLLYKLKTHIPISPRPQKAYDGGTHNLPIHKK